MKLAIFDTPRASGLGVVHGDAVYHIGKNAPFASSSITEVVQQLSHLQPAIASALSQSPVYALSDVRLRAPAPRPGKILAIARNYAAHAAEQGVEAPKVQTWFSKPVTAINGPNDDVALPAVSSQLDYEAELVVMIGRRGRHVPRERAMELVGGYMCGCDYSVRDWQKATPTMMMGKGFDTHAPIGPWLTTPDEVGDPGDLAVRCWVNGELRQDGRTSEMIFDIPSQIAHLSAAFTLEPGDLIFTGTPAGVAMAMSPPRWLKAGDEVKVEVERLGTMTARIVPEEASCVIGDR